MAVITTFARREEWRKAQARLDAQRLAYAVVSPDPGYARVGSPALVLSTEGQAALVVGMATLSGVVYGAVFG